MRLTRKKAIEISKELWAWLAETGKLKHKWPKWEEYGDMAEDCPLCEYQDRKRHHAEDCPDCPLMQTMGCYCWSTYFGLWEHSDNHVERKKYAKLFLEQLETLK